MGVRFRKDRNKWQTSVFLRGKRLCRLFETRREAQEFLRDIRLRRLGLGGIENIWTIEQAFSSFIETESALKTEKSKKGDEHFFKIAVHFLTKVRGHKLISEIQLEDLKLCYLWLGPQQEIDGWIKKPWSSTTVGKNCKLLKSVFKKLFIADRVKNNPAAYWSVDPGEKKPRRPMTPEEFFRLYAAVPLWYKPILLTLRLTGARGASIADLRWGEVDFEKAVVILRSRKGSRLKLKTIIIPIFPELHDVLSQQWNSTLARGREDFVFRGPLGQALSGHTISRIGFNYIRILGMSGVVLYGLRHAFATDLIDAGVSSDVVRQLMGHTNERHLQEYTSFVKPETLSKALTLIRGKKGSA